MLVSDDAGASWRTAAQGMFATYMPPERREVAMVFQTLADNKVSLISVRSIGMDTDQSTLALNTVLRLPEAKPED